MTTYFRFLFFLLLIFPKLLSAQPEKFELKWQRTVTTDSRPDWFSTGDEEINSQKGTERGIAYSAIDDHVYVSSRGNNAPAVYIIDPETGEDVGQLLTLNINRGDEWDTGGYSLNSIQVTDDGQIVACNLTLSSGENEVLDTYTKINAFRVYKWEFEGAAPQLLIDYQEGGYRLGDKLTVVGDLTGNAVIWAGVNDRALALRWTVTNGIIIPSPEEVYLENCNSATHLSIAPIANSATSLFYASGQNLVPTLFTYEGKNYTALNIPLDTLPKSAQGGIITSLNDHLYLSMYMPATASAMVIDVTKGGENVSQTDIYGVTESIGTPRTTSFGAGSCAPALINDTLNLFLCTPDVGIARIKVLGISATPVGIANIKTENSLNIFPNPANNRTTINISGIKDVDSGVLQIISLAGKTEKQIQIVDFSANSNYTIDVSDIEAGLYIFRVVANNQQFVQKVSIVH